MLQWHVPASIPTAFVMFALYSAQGQNRIEPTILTTRAGVQFAIGAKKGPARLPVLLIFAGSMAQTFQPEYYPVATRLFAEHGILPVTLDIPCHGADHRAGEPPSLAGWRSRMEKGEDFIGSFQSRVSSVLDYLIAEGYADASRIFLAGTSRGGFLAFHVAAADPRVRAVISFAPVTDLLALQEFKGVSGEASARALDVDHLAPKLAGRPVWMCIGNNDQRVNTDSAIRFSRRLVVASLAAGKHPDVEIVVQPSKGHTIAPDSHDRAAEWLASRLDGIR